MTSREALNQKQFEEHLPPEPGSQPIPEGHVRLWHYTSDEALPSIRERGLSAGHGQGHTYGEPDMVWAAAHEQEPPKHRLQDRPHVEFHAHAQHDLDLGAYGGSLGARQPTAASEALQEHIRGMYRYGSHVTMRGDVTPERILAVHEPWHQHVRDLESDPRRMESYTIGDFKDFNFGDPDIDKALAHVRAKHARGAYG